MTMMMELTHRLLLLLTIFSVTVNAYQVRTYGDPSIQTLDDVRYDFEGRGEFIYLNSSEMMMQIRTEFIDEHRPVGTIITVAAIKVDGHVIEVHENLDHHTLHVYKDGQKIKCTFAEHFAPCIPESRTPFVLAGIQEQTTVVTLQSGAFHNFRAVEFKGHLGLEIILTGIKPRDHSTIRGLAGGLVGGSLSGRNGSQYASNSTVKQLFEFGDSWRLQTKNESIFNYSLPSNGLHGNGNFTFYSKQRHEPVFLEDLLDNHTVLFNQDGAAHNESEIRVFETLCRNNSHCLLEIARADDIEAGKLVMAEIEAVERRKAYAENVPPEFIPDIADEITLYNGVNFTYTLYLHDVTKDKNTGDTRHFNIETSLPPEVYNFDNVSGLFSWNVTDLTYLRHEDSLILVFKVFDRFERSAEKRFHVKYCGCKKTTQCDFDNAIEGNGITMAHCICSKYYSGEYCEQHVDICAIETCFDPQSCNSSVEEGDNPCSPCPSGFTGDGRTCANIDECLAQTDNCTQICTDTEGGFTCSCQPGYSLQDDNSTCLDNDECFMDGTLCGNGTCENTPGSFYCVCPVGYENTTSTCTDIDECTQKTHNCSQTCSNTPGSYTCLCSHGYELSNDGISCHEIMTSTQTTESTTTTATTASSTKQPATSATTTNTTEQPATIEATSNSTKQPSSAATTTNATEQRMTSATTTTNATMQAATRKATANSKEQLMTTAPTTTNANTTNTTEQSKTTETTTNSTEQLITTAIPTINATQSNKTEQPMTTETTTNATEQPTPNATATDAKGRSNTTSETATPAVSSTVLPVITECENDVDTKQCLEIAKLIAEIDKLTAEKDVLNAEKYKLNAEKEKLNSEKDKLQQETRAITSKYTQELELFEIQKQKLQCELSKCDGFNNQP